MLLFSLKNTVIILLLTIKKKKKKGFTNHSLLCGLNRKSSIWMFEEQPLYFSISIFISVIHHHPATVKKKNCDSKHHFNMIYLSNTFCLKFITPVFLNRYSCTFRQLWNPSKTLSLSHSLAIPLVRGIYFLMPGFACGWTQAHSNWWLPASFPLGGSAI